MQKLTFAQDAAQNPVFFSLLSVALLGFGAWFFILGMCMLVNVVIYAK